MKVGAPEDSAMAGTDYATVDDVTLTIAAGTSSGTATFKIDPTQDAMYEGAHEMISVSGTLAGVTVTETTFTISDDDATPTGIALSVSPPSESESEGVKSVTVTATVNGDTTFASSKSVTVTVGASGDSATEGTDYATVDDVTLTVAAGARSGTATFSIDPTQDAVDEGSDESVSVNGTLPEVTVMGTSFTITDDEATPTVTLSLSSSSISENGESSTVTATLNRATSETVTVTVSASPVSPAVTSDFTLGANNVLTIAAGSTASTETVTIAGVDNNVDAPDKTVTVSASVSGGNGVSAPPDVMLTIVDDDGAPMLTLGLSASSISENGGTANVTASLSGATSETVTVTVSAIPVSPAVIGDYSLTSDKTLTIAAGSTESTETVTITGVDNSVDTPDKSVTVSATVSGGHGVSAPSDVTLTITDDEATPTLTLSLSSPSISENGGTTNVTASLSEASSEAVTVTASAIPVSPAVSGDYSLTSNKTLTIAAGVH